MLRTGPSCGFTKLGALAFRHFARRIRAGDGDEGIVQAGTLDRELLYAGAAVDQCGEQGLDPAHGQFELPDAASLARAGGERGPPGSVRISRLQPDLRPQPVARLGHQALEADPAAGDDRDPLA